MMARTNVLNYTEISMENNDVEPILSDKYNVLYLCQIYTPFRFIVFADFKGRHW